MILLEKNFDCNGIILGKTVVFNSYPRNNFKKYFGIYIWTFKPFILSWENNLHILTAERVQNTVCLTCSLIGKLQKNS